VARIAAGVLDDGGFLAKVLAQRPCGAHSDILVFYCSAAG
jgi:hypothetical protein